MDNASKAIIVAGGFLIGMLIISLFFFVYTNLQDFKQSSDEARQAIEIDAFNGMFTDYTHYFSNDGQLYNGNEYILGAQIYNLLGLAIEQNSKNNENYTIKINGTDSVDTLKSLREEFYFTENLAEKYKITAIDYSYGVISNISYTKYD